MTQQYQCLSVNGKGGLVGNDEIRRWLTEESYQPLKLEHQQA
jgi:hypothetical protein